MGKLKATRQESRGQEKQKNGFDGESVWRDTRNWGDTSRYLCGNLVSLKLTGIYEGDPNDDSKELKIKSINWPSLIARKDSQWWCQLEFSGVVEQEDPMENSKILKLLIKEKSCFPQTESGAPLLRTVFPNVIEHEEVQLVPTWNSHPYILALFA